MLDYKKSRAPSSFQAMREVVELMPGLGLPSGLQGLPSAPSAVQVITSIVAIVAAPAPLLLPTASV